MFLTLAYSTLCPMIQPTDRGSSELVGLSQTQEYDHFRSRCSETGQSDSLVVVTSVTIRTFSCPETQHRDIPATYLCFVKVKVLQFSTEVLTSAYLRRRIDLH